MKAITRALDAGPPVDPAALAGARGVCFVSPALTLAGSGRAAVFSLAGGLLEPSGPAGLVHRLGAIECDDPLGLPGTGPVAFGALPFESGAPGEMVVPSLLYGRGADGVEWATSVGEHPPEPTRELLRAALERRSVEPPGPPALVAGDPADYPAAVAVATRAIAAGRLRKVVLARRLVVDLGAAPSPPAVLARLAAQEPSATAFLVGHGPSVFVGASPELLVSRRGASVRSHPLAGTAASGTGPAECLLASAKDMEEHALVVADIARVLDPHCSELVVPAEPSLVSLHSMNHLGTRIEGCLMAEGGRLPSVLELVAELHPTPAVGGVPRAPALELIERLEPGPRGPWAGPVGWLDAAGDGDWVVGLRSTIIEGSTAVVWAGAGIVAASDPLAELAETDLKLAPALEGLAPGASALLEGYPLRS